MKIAVPTEGSGGLDAPVSAHFGHSEAFALVPVENEQPGEPEMLANGGHGPEGCMGPVNRLKQAGADAVVVGGLGMRPLAGLQEVGIEVYFNEGAASVGDAVRLVLQGKARRFAPAQACQGHGSCGGEGHSH